jgi:hypothetical protein
MNDCTGANINMRVKKREEQAEQRERAAEQDPHLVVAGPEVADVRGLEVAHLRAAFVLRVARRRIFMAVLPAVVEQEQQAERSEYSGRDDPEHACLQKRLYT